MKIITCIGANLQTSELANVDTGEFNDGYRYDYPETEVEYPKLINHIEELLNKDCEFIIITTNSPHIVFAVEVLAAKKELVREFFNFIEDKDGVGCTNDLEPRYKIMLEPFQDLENMRWSFHDD